MLTNRRTGRTSCCTRQTIKKERKFMEKSEVRVGRARARPRMPDSVSPLRWSSAKIEIKPPAHSSDYCSSFRRILYSRGIFGGFMRNQKQPKQNTTYVCPNSSYLTDLTAEFRKSEEKRQKSLQEFNLNWI